MTTSDEYKRAEVALRIAQHKFKQAVNRDEKPRHALPFVSVDSSTRFFDGLDAVFRENTTANVQTCKNWIIKHIVSSKTRVLVLGEYLVAVAKSVGVEKPPKSAKAARNRIDILLVVSDVLHAEKFHRENATAPAYFAEIAKPNIEELAELAALAVPGKDSPAEKKLKAVINFWAASGCISANDLSRIRERVEEGLAVAQGATPQRKRTYTLPEWFGDRDVAWHGLSASYMLEPLLKDPDRAIAAGSIRATRFDQKQPSDRVRKLLDNYFENIDLEYLPTGDNPTGETKKHKLWLDSMGQLVKQNNETKEITVVRNGHGWSPEFCQQMQTNGIPDRVTELRKEYKEKAAEAQRERESRRKSPPRDFGRSSRSPRRRYSYSSSSRSISRSRSRSHSRSSSHDRYDSYDRDGRRPRSSRDNDRKFSDDGTKFNDRPGRFDDRGRAPQDDFSRKRPYDRQSRWGDNQNSYSDFNSNQFQPPPQQHGYGPPHAHPAQGDPPQAYPRPMPQPQHPMSGFNLPPPPPPPGQFSMSGYPPPPPRYFNGPGGSVPPPPPPNYQGPHYSAPPNAGGYQNNSYGYGNNASGYQGGNGGYSQGPQTNFRGGHQGRGRGGYDNYRGQRRGQGRY